MPEKTIHRLIHGFSSTERFVHRAASTCSVLILSIHFAVAKDKPEDTWLTAFDLLGQSAGAYSACVHRDMTDLFAQLAVGIATGPLASDDQHAMQKMATELEDEARMNYFLAMNRPCDPSKLFANRKDVETWSVTIRQGAVKK